jgi:hypothetical protein
VTQYGLQRRIVVGVPGDEPAVSQAIRPRVTKLTFRAQLHAAYLKLGVNGPRRACAPAKK